MKGMTRRRTRALLSLLLAALLAACSVSRENVSARDLAGVLEGWPGGSATLHALHYDPATGEEVVLATGDVSAQGAFALSLPEPVTGDLYSLEPSAACPDLSYSAPDARGTSFAALELRRNDIKIGTAILADTRPTDGSSPSMLVLYSYVDKDLRVTGRCEQDGFFQGATVADLTLKAGWNTALLELLDRNDPRAGTSFKTAPIPSNLRWFYIAAPVGPAPPPVLD